MHKRFYFMLGSVLYRALMRLSTWLKPKRSGHLLFSFFFFNFISHSLSRVQKSHLYMVQSMFLKCVRVRSVLGVYEFPAYFCVCVGICMAPVSFTPRDRCMCKLNCLTVYSCLLKFSFCFCLGWWNRWRLWNAVVLMWCTVLIFFYTVFFLLFFWGWREVAVYYPTDAWAAFNGNLVWLM
jgi:hypothetical protein